MLSIEASANVVPVTSSLCQNPRSLTDFQRTLCVEDPIASAALLRQQGTDEALWVLGQKSYLMGQYVVAREHFQQLELRLNQKKKVGREFATVRYWVALAMLGEGQKKEPEAILKSLVSEKLCDSFLYCQDANSLRPLIPAITLAHYYKDQKKWGLASAILQKILKEHSDSAVRAEARWLLGTVYLEQEKPEQAFIEYVRVLKFAPQSAHAVWLKRNYAVEALLKKFGSRVTSL